MRFWRFLLGLAFIGAGILHFTKREMYEAICPDYLPNHSALVTISGIAEIAGGVGTWIPQTRKAAGWGLIALLIAVFPANLNMALESERFARVAPAWALWLRLPLQAVLVYVVKRTNLEEREP
jgi:uncharacterized membrane protein